MRKPRNGVVGPSEEGIRLMEEVRREVEGRLGAKATFEQRRDAVAAFMAEALAKAMYEDDEEDQAEGHRQRR